MRPHILTSCSYQFCVDKSYPYQLFIYSFANVYLALAQQAMAAFLPYSSAKSAGSSVQFTPVQASKYFYSLHINIHFEFIAMKMRSLHLKQRLLAIAFCCFLFAARGKAQTGVLVTYYNGTQQGYSITTSGKLYFDNSNLQIVLTNAATPVSIPVSIIQKITFSSAALPLQLVDFTLLNEKAQVTLSWKTANEINTSHFIIERSVDGTAYESVGQVASLKNSAGGSYVFADQLPKTGTSYYRLKQVDADGKYTYSKVLTVKRTATDLITLLPNPAADFIKISSTTTDRLTVKIYAADGRLMITGTYTPGDQISISKLTPGMYMATINDKTYKLIKQ